MSDADYGDDVLVVAGERVFTVAAVVQLLEGLRAVTTAEGGGELLLRFFDDELETITLPKPDERLGLIGMSHVPAAAMVISIQHRVGPDGGQFLATAVRRDGAAMVFVGRATEPISIVTNGFEAQPLMHLLMTKVACGRPAAPDDGPSPYEWLSRLSLSHVAAEIDTVSPPDDDEGAAAADDLLRAYLTVLIGHLEQSSTEGPKVSGPSPAWPDLLGYATWLGALDWTDVDAEAFGVARGYGPEQGAWWTAKGLAGLELITHPSIEETLVALVSRRPFIASRLQSALMTLHHRVVKSTPSQDDQLRSRWRFDTPEALLRLVWRINADPDFAEGLALVGYRRDGGLLKIVKRIDGSEDASGTLTLDLLQVPDVGRSDGVVMLWKSGDTWGAHALNQEGEQGVADSASREYAFLDPVDDFERLITLRRLLTGMPQTMSDVSPYDWVCRRVLYGVARSLETGRPDVDPDKRARAEPSAVPPTGAVDAERTLVELVDAMLFLSFHRHFDVLVRAIGTPSHLRSIATETVSQDRSWTIFAEVVALVDQLQWADFDGEQLAEGWAEPIDEARWWGTSVLVHRQVIRIPDATESLMRCAFVLERIPGGSAAYERLMGRITHVFGDDIPVAWDLLPELSLS